MIVADSDNFDCDFNIEPFLLRPIGQVPPAIDDLLPRPFIQCESTQRVTDTYCDRPVTTSSPYSVFPKVSAFWAPEDGFLNHSQPSDSQRDERNSCDLFPQPDRSRLRSLSSSSLRTACVQFQTGREAVRTSSRRSPPGIRLCRPPPDIPDRNLLFPCRALPVPPLPPRKSSRHRLCVLRSTITCLHPNTSFARDETSLTRVWKRNATRHR
ncbi:uncharacterized protein IWZ02DRAFT_145920 [Phyllosticta citriasiana]|uniref:uncharacterized protein n=1 Tax=Phyllosticta citriasiana TaxID=595635 RepID=UPI0030FD7EF6